MVQNLHAIHKPFQAMLHTRNLHESGTLTVGMSFVYCCVKTSFACTGGLICRGILESYPTNIHTFVSLSSPQAGQYGGRVLNEQCIYYDVY